MGNNLSEHSASFGFPIAVLIAMIGVFYISILNYLNNIPAYFLGMIVWFGSNIEIEINNISLLGITLLSGYIFAWTNAAFSNQIELKPK